MKQVEIKLTDRELNLIIIGMTSGSYPLSLQNAAFDLVMKLRDLLREAS